MGAACPAVAITVTMTAFANCPICIGRHLSTVTEANFTGVAGNAALFVTFKNSPPLFKNKIKIKANCSSNQTVKYGMGNTTKKRLQVKGASK